MDALQSLKKANKDYKLKLAIKNGFKSVKDYMDFLEGKNVVTVKVKTRSPKTTQSINLKPTIHIVNIIDCSSSMSGPKMRAANTTIGKDIELIKSTKNINYTYSLVSFSNNYKIQTHYLFSTADQVRKLELVSGGMTALYQAVGSTLEKIKENVKPTDKIIVSIITDGEENDSTGKWANWQTLSKFIKELQETNFTITFVGTEQDVHRVVRDLNVDFSNTVSYDGTGEGLANTMVKRSMSLSDYSSKVVLGKDVSKGFYKQTGKL